MPYGEKFEKCPPLRLPATQGPAPQRNKHPLHHPPAGGGVHRRRERRHGRRSGRRPPARRPRRPGRRGQAKGHPCPIRRRSRGDSRRLHGHLRGPRSRPGASARNATWPTSRTLLIPYGSSPPRTSCTTPAPSSPTTGYSAKTSGRGSTARKKARSGTTAPSSTPCGAKVPSSRN